MSQHDYVISNQGFASYRSDHNSSLSAIVSNNSGATEPSTTYAYQWWYDETTDTLKMRNSDNDAWITMFTFDQTADTYSLATDVELTITENLDLTGSATISGDLTVDTDTLHVDSSNNRVGVGTTSPSTALDVSGTVTATNFSGTINTPIAMADCFLLGSNIVGGGTFDITSGFARRTGDGFNQIGTGLTESSGEFSFPQTGFYLINFFSTITNGGNDTTCALTLKYTDNNFSTESDLLQHNAGHSSTGNSIIMLGASSTIIDVTDITNQKFKFNAFSLNSTINGSAAVNLTGFTIIRLGDT